MRERLRCVECSWNAARGMAVTVVLSLVVSSNNGVWAQPPSLSEVAEMPQLGEYTAPGTGSILDEPISAVRIEGNVTIPTAEIERHIKTRPGRPATQKSIKDDVDALVRLRWFAIVEPSMQRGEKGPVLIYRVLERPIVRRVEYIGNDKIKTAKFEALTNLKPGSPYDVSANRECARRILELYKEKGFFFATVELEKGDSKDDREVIFRIVEGRKVHVSSVKFEGNEFFNDPLLKTKKVTKTRMLGLFGGKYDPATIQEDLAAVQQYYHSLGFFSVKIEPEQRWTEDKSSVQLVYHIEEGPRYSIRDISFMGNDVVPREELESYLDFQEGEEYASRKIATSVQKMKDRYGSMGRLFAQVDVVPVFLEEPGEVDLVVKVDESSVFRIRDVRVHIVGDHPHTRRTLYNNIAQIHPGDIADPKKIKLTKSRLEGSQYFETGPQNGVRLEISKVEEPDWLQTEGVENVELVRGQDSGPFTPLAPLASPPINVAGHTPPGRAQLSPQSSRAGMPRPAYSGNQEAVRQPRPASKAAYQPATAPSYPAERFPRPAAQPATDDDDREPEVDAAPGEFPVPLTMSAPGRSITRAQSAEPLAPPQNYIYDDSPEGDPFGNPVRAPDEFFNQPPPEFIDVDAYLTEARTGRLMFGVGVNSNNGVVGNLVFQENNFDILRAPTSWADIWNGTAWRGAGQRLRLEGMPGSEVSRYLADWQDPYFLDTDYNLGISGFYYQRFFEAWEENRVGGRVRVGRQLTDRVAASVAFRFEDVLIEDFPSYAPPDVQDVAGHNFLTTFRGTISHDTRDAAFMPSEGHFVEFGYEQGVGEFTYPRLEVEGRQYFTVYARPDGYGKHIVTARGDVGWTGSDTPVFERFYAGGFQDFRGYAFRGVSPIENGLRVGGDWRFLGGLEYSMPVTANEMVRAVAFTDFGTIDSDVSLDKFRMTVGGGLRVMIPAMGPVPIALDWAVPIVQVDGDNEQLFSFYIGINR